MPTQKLEKKSVRKLTRSGGGKGSVYVTIPVEYIRALRWQEKQKVVVSKKGETIIIEDWKK